MTNAFYIILIKSVTGNNKKLNLSYKIKEVYNDNKKI